MPHPSESARHTERTHALLVVCVLAFTSLVIALVGATPARVSATDALGDQRDPGEAALIVSHRGGGAAAPENTLPAVAEALRAGFGYVEVDVALTADGVPVLMHDATVDRTTDGHGPIADLTASQVRALDAGSWFGPEFAGTRVPTLTELLDLLAASDGHAIVELKGEWEAETISAALGEIAARDLERRITLASFDAATLALAEAESEVIARLLNLAHVPDDIVRAAEEARVRGVIVDRKAVLARPELVQELHAAGLRIVAYTLNRDTQWESVTDLGVDGIVTDEPLTLSGWQRALADGG